MPPGRQPDSLQTVLPKRGLLYRPLSSCLCFPHPSAFRQIFPFPHQVPSHTAVKSPIGKLHYPVTQMGSLEILHTYERLAGLTAQMAAAATARNWHDFEALENQCARQVEYAKTLKKTPLTGEPLRRKIRLLKEIMANDRSIREITEPWQQQLPSALRH